MKINGQTVIVTGGGSGLGAATARYLSDKGAHVAIFDFDSERGAEVASDVGGRAYQVDVSDAQTGGQVVEEVARDFGVPARIAVNCAGIAPAARVVGREGKMSTDIFEQTLRVNLIGTYNVMSHAARLMQTLDPLDTGERGVVINTASAAYQDGQLGQAAYAASKGGVAAMCLPVAREFAKTGIRCVAIAPGLFRTPMMEALPEETTAAITANIPFPDRLGDPAEFGKMVAQIVENPYLNGTTIRLDAAVRLPPR